MKRTFLRILPLAVAVLLATSCSKDENSDNNIVVNGSQEIVVNQEKCISVTGAVDKKSSVSKLSCDGTNFSFDGGETIKFSGEGGKIHGETTVDAAGNFTVDLYYPAEWKVKQLDQKDLTATIGTNPTNVRGSYDSFDDAVKDVYETGTTHIQVLTRLDPTNFNESYIVDLWELPMNVEVAFVENEKSEAINVSVNDGTPVSLAAGKICIVPTGVKVAADGKTKNSTEAGKIYTIVAPVAATGIAIVDKPTKEIVWGNNAFTLTAAVEPANATDPITWTCATNNAVFINNNEEQVATINGSNCSVLVTGTGSVSITATVGGFSDTYTFSVSADYVDLSGDGILYYYTKEKGDGAAYYWSDRSSNLPDGARVAEASELALMDDNFDHTNSGGEKPLIDVINKNGSGAKITVRTGMNYWSNTQYYENGYPMYEGVFVQFYVSDNKYSQAGYAWTNGREQKPIILVRDAN